MAEASGECPWNAQEQELEAAYRRLARVMHPDKLLGLRKTS